MTVDKAYIVDLAPEFAAVDSGRIDRLVSIAILQVNASRWLTKTDLGVAYLVCHMLKLAANFGSGVVTSKKIGDLQVDYAVVGANTDPYSLTSYGIEFKRIRASIMAGPLVT